MRKTRERKKERGRGGRNRDIARELYRQTERDTYPEEKFTDHYNLIITIYRCIFPVYDVNNELFYMGPK